MKKDKPKPEKKRESARELSSREWREIMGTNRDTYKRGPGGALRNKRRR
ncbi:hypothetical protein [Terribacillus saccharophilus]|nr:hypothetical protein [Terribacillus saccharophilus]MEC0288821.1 hypothetical protein [Terribacillus saccharophilus]